MQGRAMQNKRAKYSNFKHPIISEPKLHKFVVECTSVRHILGYIAKCSKWRPLIFTQQRRRLRHWSTVRQHHRWYSAANQTTRQSGVASDRPRLWLPSCTLVPASHFRSCSPPDLSLDYLVATSLGWWTAALIDRESLQCRDHDATQTTRASTPDHVAVTLAIVASLKWENV